MEPIAICLWSLFGLVLIASYKWADSEDRCHALRQRLIRADNRIADLQDQLRHRHADIERLGSQVSALSHSLDVARHDPH